MTGTWRVGAAVIAIAAAALLTTAWHSGDRPPHGFAGDSGVAQREFERRFLTLPSADSIRDAHRLLTAQPHPAGSRTRSRVGRVDSRPVSSGWPR